MKKTFIVLASALAFCAGAFAQENSSEKKFNWYGFIRTYAPLDTRECIAGTEDMFTYVPKDISKSASGEDLNAGTSFRFAALTSRLGLDVKGYRINGWNIGAKIEADFYAGLSGSTGTAQLRLRQAFFTMDKDIWSIKIGQAWHPMAADMPDVFSLNTGAPFGPFSRTPLASLDIKLSRHFTLSAAAIWQMQYTSAGPEGASANYIKYGCTPEIYLGITGQYKGGLVRAGLDLLSIKPRKDNGNVKVADRITTLSPFIYAQYKYKGFTAKAKTIFASGGEHLNLNGGYALTATGEDGTWYYTPTRNWSSWVSLSYGTKLQGVLFAGYARNFGTRQAILEGEARFTPAGLYFSKNSASNIVRAWRITPTVIYNLGKVQFGLEYELTAAQYGDTSMGINLANALYDLGLHWVNNHRFQLLFKYSF
ncbi:MAG: hypothetical protein MJY61_04650 [Bacteroidales bacterium]|nr:hypothetical protein [Bacteroidales bacterium]